MSKSVVLKICRGDSGDARLKCVSLGHVCTQKEEPQRHSERGRHRQERRQVQGAEYGRGVVRCGRDSQA